MIAANGSPPLRHFFERSCDPNKRNEAQIGPANSLHASVQYSECNKKLDLVIIVLSVVRKGLSIRKHKQINRFIVQTVFRPMRVSN